MSYFAYVARPPQKDGVKTSPLEGQARAAEHHAPSPPALREIEEYGAVRHLTPEIALQGIYEISKIVTGPQRIGVMLANVASALSGFLPMRHAVIVLVDRHGEQEIVASGGHIGDGQSADRPKIPQKVVDRIVATGLPLTVPDVSAEAHFAGYDTTTGNADGLAVAFLGVPVRADNQVVGVLSIDRLRRRDVALRFDDETRFLNMVANLIGQAVSLQTLITEDRARLMDEQNRLHKEITSDARQGGAARASNDGIVGDSEAIRRVTEMVQVVAPTNTTVLLRGESGTGKELFARAIHEQSVRKGKPFIKLNCAALSETVLESELFGHEKGAFTNAVASRQGRFEMADGGTLFLDEIGEISASFQAKLLRVLQEGEFERVGGAKTLKVDVRIVCATNRDLEDMVANGTFRADLYYRIGMLPIELPPLRERPSDIPKLASAFVSRFNKENSRRLKLTNGAVSLLERCYFPGNVRELENCVRRAATFARADAIESTDLACVASRCLSSMLWKGASSRPATAAVPIMPTAPVRTLPLSAAPPPIPSMVEPVVSSAAIADAAAQSCACPDEGQRRTCSSAESCTASASRLTERERLVQAMETSGWVQAKAARILNLSPRQIGYALRKYGVEVKRF